LADLITTRSRTGRPASADTSRPCRHQTSWAVPLRSTDTASAWLFAFAAEVQLAEIEKTPEANQRLLALAGKGLQLEVIAEDDRQGYRSARNSLLNTTRAITGQEPSVAYGTPKQLREYEQSGIWRWVSSDIVPSTKDKPRRMLVDVTDRIKEAGTYTVTWQYLEGADGLFIISTGLYSAKTAQPKPEDLTEIALDKHDGFSGGGNSLNVYTLKLPQRDPALHYFVQGLIWYERAFDTFGHVLFNKQ
jgi:hypothetical protein